MKKLLLALLLCCFSVVHSTEYSIGEGFSYRADKKAGNLHMLTIHQNKWNYEVAYWDAYERSPHPEIKTYEIKKHMMFSVYRNMYKASVSDNVEFFFDFGLTATSQIQRTTSSRILFRENLGLKYKNFSIFLTHSSNAGIVPPNTGEDGLVFQYRF